MKRLLIVSLLACLPLHSLASTIEMGTDGIGPSNTTATAGVRGVNTRFEILDGGTTTITSGRTGGDLTYDWNAGPFGDLVNGGWVGWAGRSNIAYNTGDDPWIVVDENFTGPPTLEGPAYSPAVDPNSPPSWAANGIGSHANSGVTFDLEYFRNNPTFGTTAGQAFVLSGRSGANDFKRAGTVSTSILVDGVVQYVTPKLAWNQPTQPFVIGLPATARYVTIGVTSGGDGIGADHGVFENIVLEPVDVAPSMAFYRGRADVAADDSVTALYWSDDPNSLGTQLNTSPFGSYDSRTNVAVFDPIAQVLDTSHTYYLTAAVSNTGGPGGLRATFHFDKGFMEIGGLTDLDTNLLNWEVSSTAPGPGTIWEPAWAAPVASGWYTGTDQGISSNAIWIWRDAGGGTYASGTVYLRAALTPTPEPTSMVLLAFGGLAMLFCLRRRESVPGGRRALGG